MLQRQEVPDYDEDKVNDYLTLIGKGAPYIIDPEGSGYDIWLNYLEIQTAFTYSEFKDIDAGIALIRTHYIDKNDCCPKYCYNDLLVEFAYGQSFYKRYMYNVKGGMKCRV